jgi:hypothetical protein
MHRINLVLAGVCSAALLFCARLHGQPPAENSPTPPNNVPEKREAAGYLRVWNFANSLRPPIAVSLVGGPISPVILSRTTQLSYLASYRSVAPGRYKLDVRPGQTDQKAGGAPVATGKELMPPVAIEVADRTFQTIIFQDQAGKPQVAILNDSTSGIPKGGKRLRVLGFTVAQNASLRANNQVIAEHILGGLTQQVFPAKPGSMTLTLSNKLANGHEAQQSSELDFNRVDSITAVVMLDRYGRLTLITVEDGRAD